MSRGTRQSASIDQAGDTQTQKYCRVRIEWLIGNILGRFVLKFYIALLINTFSIKTRY